MSGRVLNIVKFAVLSRTVVFFLQIVFNLLPDHGADAFKPVAEHGSHSVFDHLAKSLFDGFHKWDSKYFLHIAEHGYQEEKMFAFFPLFPATLRVLASLFQELTYHLSYFSCLLLAGATINALFFVGAVVGLYKLTATIYGNESYAYNCAILFSFNPACIFFSANYTESLYSCCCFWALFYLEKRSFLKATVLFTFAAAARSNGIVNAGFTICFTVRSMVCLLYEHNLCGIFTLVKFLSSGLSAILSVLFIFFPFAAFNCYGFYHFCFNQTYLLRHHSGWCSDKIPLLYSNVQQTYWNIGFLNYYTFRKIPNIILAVPCAMIVTFGALQYVKCNNIVMQIFAFDGGSSCLKSPRVKTRDLLIYCSQNISLYFMHATFLLLFGLGYMHVEVVTRFLFSASPFPIWVCSSILMRDLDRSKLSMRLQDVILFRDYKTWRFLPPSSKLILMYFIGYSLIGTLLHVNYLPWT